MPSRKEFAVSYILADVTRRRLRLELWEQLKTVPDVPVRDFLTLRGFLTAANESVTMEQSYACDMIVAAWAGFAHTNGESQGPA